MNMKEELTNNIPKIHTTELGIERIKRNLNLNTENVVEYCIEIVKNKNSKIEKKGKNYYVKYEDIVLTINSSSFTIITAHKNDQ